MYIVRTYVLLETRQLQNIRTKGIALKIVVGGREGGRKSDSEEDV